MKTTPETLVLRRPGTRLSRRDAMILGAVVAGAIVSLIWLLHPVNLVEKLSERPELLLKFIGDFVIELLATLVLGLYMARAVRYERLTLDRSGIHYQSPLPAGLAGLQPSWSHSWAQIREAEILVSRLAHPNLVAVVLDVVTAKRKIPGRWVVDAGPGAPRESVFSLRLRQQNVQAIAAEAERSPLVEYMRRIGVKIVARPMPGAGFALESNRAALGAAVGMVALLLYTVADLMINTESYAVTPPLVLFVLAGAVAFLAAGLLLGAAGVPRAETIAVALLLGGAVGAALYPGALRLNQLTDTDGLRAHEYRMKDHGVWEPRSTDLPTLRFTDFHEFWGQFKPGAQRQFLLRRGGLGFFQVEMAPVREEMKAYYRANP